MEGEGTPTKKSFTHEKIQYDHKVKTDIIQEYRRTGIEINSLTRDRSRTVSQQGNRSVFPKETEEKKVDL